MAIITTDITPIRRSGMYPAMIGLDLAHLGVRTHVRVHLEPMQNHYAIRLACILASVAIVNADIRAPK